MRSPASPAPKKIHISLDPRTVVITIATAIKVSTDAVAIFLTALETTDVTNLPAVPGELLQFRLHGLDADEHKRTLKAWIFAKGFQDLLRAVRQSLEEAYVFTRVVEWPDGRIAGLELRARYERVCSKASRMLFPDLMKQLVGKLTSPLSFSDEFLSLQKARNCLEHQAGIVGVKQVDESGELKLTLPYMHFYLKEGDNEIEMVPDHETKVATDVMIRRSTMTKVLKLGDRFELDARDFLRIAQACLYFAYDLEAKLPVRLAKS
jgi:hypothetical protein